MAKIISLSSFSITVALFFFSLFTSTITTAPPTNILLSGDRLSTGESLVAGNYNLIMQHDCNLVLYSTFAAIWSTNTTAAGGPCYLVLQATGELAIHRKHSLLPLWSTEIFQHLHGRYALVLHPDGELKVYTRCWDSDVSTSPENEDYVTAEEASGKFAVYGGRAVWSRNSSSESEFGHRNITPLRHRVVNTAVQ